MMSKWATRWGLSTNQWVFNWNLFYCEIIRLKKTAVETCILHTVKLYVKNVSIYTCIFIHILRVFRYWKLCFNLWWLHPWWMALLKWQLRKALVERWTQHEQPTQFLPGCLNYIGVTEPLVEHYRWCVARSQAPWRNLFDQATLWYLYIMEGLFASRGSHLVC